tara:strand:- start:31095 stop:32864 length:1770 start_codon:yes stop_codon:yes gene_type:complete
MHESIFTQIGFILLLTLISQWVAWRFKFPVIVLLSGFGILFGPVLQLINPEQTFGHLLTPLIELVVAIILFEGGLSLKFHEFKKVSSGLIRLFTLSIILQVALITYGGVYLIGINWKVAIILGALLVVTGPTVIIPALREARLKTKVAHYLKWEGIVNDPVGAMLAIVLLQVVTFHDSNFSMLVIDIVKGNLIALVLAYILYYLIKWLAQRALLPEFLKIPFFLCIVLVQFILANHLQSGAGLLAVTIFGIFIGNSGLDLVKELRNFKESLTTFSVSIIFIILSATLDINAWKEFQLQHYVYIFFLAFMVRPLAIIPSTFKSGMTFREQLLIGLYGPKGIVAASVSGVIGIELLDAGYSEGALFLPIVFSVILLTVITHSFYLRPLAKKLHLHHSKSNGVLIMGASPFSIQLAQKLMELEMPVMISDTTWSRLSYARQSGINVHYGQILSDIKYGEPDLTQYNYLLALTDDNSYNELACHILAHTFGTDHVYKLPIEDDFFNESESEASDYQKFKEKPVYYNLMKLFHRGSLFHITELTEEYNYDQFLKDHMSDTLLPIIIIRENKRVEFYSTNKNLVPSIGDKILYYQ